MRTEVGLGLVETTVGGLGRRRSTANTGIARSGRALRRPQDEPARRHNGAHGLYGATGGGEQRRVVRPRVSHPRDPGHGPDDVLRRDLLDHDAVTVLAGRDGDQVVAGAVLHRSTDVVGVSNFFSNLSTNRGSAAANWADCLGHIGALLPGAVLVGYESKQALDAARFDVFETAGPLRIWQREG